MNYIIIIILLCTGNNYVTKKYFPSQCWDEHNEGILHLHVCLGPRMMSLRMKVNCLTSMSPWGSSHTL